MNKSWLKRRNKKICYALACFQLFIAWITHSNVKFEAHYWNIDAIARAFVTDCTTTMTTMMLSYANLSLIHHGTKIPEKWSCAHLTRITFNPFAYLFSHRIHFPENKHRILTSRYQLLRCIREFQSRYFVTAQFNIFDI